MKITFTINAWSDYRWWLGQDRRVVQRINTLIDDILRNGYSGVGKPEPLRHQFAGYWSRRITGEHRLVYQLIDDSVEIVGCRYHYEKRS